MYYIDICTPRPSVIIHHMNTCTSISSETYNNLPAKETVQRDLNSVFLHIFIGLGLNMNRL
jgi:hypothetical protein